VHKVFCEGARDGQEFLAVFVLIPSHIVSRSKVLHAHCPRRQGGGLYLHKVYMHIYTCSDALTCMKMDIRSFTHPCTKHMYIHTHRIDTCIHVTCSLHTASILSRMHVHMGAHLYTCLYSCMCTKSCTAYAQCLHVHYARAYIDARAYSWNWFKCSRHAWARHQRTRNLRVLWLKRLD